MQAVLSNLPACMSLFKCPMSMVNKLEKLRRDFLWQGKETKKKLHLVIESLFANQRSVEAWESNLLCS